MARLGPIELRPTTIIPGSVAQVTSLLAAKVRVITTPPSSNILFFVLYADVTDIARWPFVDVHQSRLQIELPNVSHPCQAGHGERLFGVLLSASQHRMQSPEGYGWIGRRFGVKYLMLSGNMHHSRSHFARAAT